MIDIGPLALAAAAIFFGAAFYVGFAEHFARQQLDDRAALTQWKPAYERGTKAAQSTSPSIAKAVTIFPPGCFTSPSGIKALSGRP